MCPFGTGPLLQGLNYPNFLVVKLFCFTGKLCFITLLAM
jgi:hypothetical protein